MAATIELQERPAQTTMSVRRRTAVDALPQIINEAYAAIGQYLGPMGVVPAGPPFAAYYNMDMQDLDVELGFPVADKIAGTDDIHASEIPAMQAVVTVHTGPYTEVENTYNAIMTWLEQHGLQWSGVAYEFYLNDPSNTVPAELQTQIVLPVKK